MGYDVERFLDRFAAFGARPGAASYLELFHPDATLYDAGMEQPLSVPEIPAHIEGILGLAPDFRMTPERWREREGTVFVEARNQATLAGHEARWRSVYCVDLEGDLVMRGRRYYDRRALFAMLDPNLPALRAYEPVVTQLPAGPDPFGGPGEIVRAVGEAWRQEEPTALLRLFREDGTLVGPDLPRPISRGALGPYHCAVRSVLRGLRMELLQWAGDDSLAFVEWRLQAETARARVTIGIVGRFDLAGGLILSGRTYFDTLELATTLAMASPSESLSA
jgi:hypothetical protein